MIKTPKNSEEYKYEDIKCFQMHWKKEDIYWIKLWFDISIQIMVQ